MASVSKQKSENDEAKKLVLCNLLNKADAPSKKLV